MANCKRCPPGGPNRGYLVSFGDTMTALLAFFIVLNSLADEQTGANLHAGTGSFVRALNSLGLPSLYPGNRSFQTFQQKESAPQYLVGDDSNEDTTERLGPDHDPNALRVVDREQEDFNRFLQQMKSQYPVQSTRERTGEVTFDFFEPLSDEAPLLKPRVAQAVSRMLPVLAQPNREVEITVWATTPSRSAWTRAVEQSAAIADEVADANQLDSLTRRRLRGIGRPWLWSDAQRPVLSVTARSRETSSE